MIITPSKHISTARLVQIKKDNCIGESGKEYDEAEIEALLIEKSNREALAFVNNANKTMERLAHQAAINDFLGTELIKIEAKPRIKSDLGSAIKKDQKFAYVLKKSLFDDQEFQAPLKFSQKLSNKYLAALFSAIGA